MDISSFNLSLKGKGMRVGFIVPTELEAVNFNVYNKHVSCVGYGAGKVAACSAAATLIFEKKCDTIIVWGLAGGMSERVSVNDIVIGESVAYRDYNIAPLMNSTGLGYVPGFSENGSWVALDKELNGNLTAVLKETFKGRNVVSDGKICTGDQFVQHSSRETCNDIEKEADAVDMESAAVVHFCENLNKFSGMNLKVGIVRVISDNADHSAHVDFEKFLKEFSELNKDIYFVRKTLLEKTWDLSDIDAAIKDYQGFPTKGVLFKDIWGIMKDRKVFECVCYKMYDLFNIEFNGAKITKVAGIESRGFLFGFEIAKMFGVPFVPVRKAGKLPGEVFGEEYNTEYSITKLEIQKESFEPIDKVLLVDDIVATGGSLVAAKKAIEKTGASCRHCLTFGRIKTLDCDRALRDNGLFATYLKDF